jgi:hypothetical protein
MVRYKNEIYVGPGQKKFAGIHTNGIARWNGSTWSAVGSGLEAIIIDGSNEAQAYGLYVHDDKLYVVGAFRSVHGDTCNSVAYWDGANWYGMNFPVDFTNDVPLNFKIIYYKNEFYVGGNCYDNLGGGINNDIARFDGVQWKQVGGGLKGGLSDITDMVVYKNELYVCGYFRKIDGNVGNKIMRWDGVQWKDVGGGICESYAIATGMIVYEDKLYVVGIFDCVGYGLPARDIAVWDGDHWCSFGNSFIDNKISCIGSYNGDIYIGGGFTTIDSFPVKFFAKWVGSHSTDTCAAPVSVALEPQTARQLLISPDPAFDYVTLAANGSFATPLSVKVYDASGNEVTNAVQVTSNTGAGQLTIQIGRLPAGFYYIHAMASGFTYSGKFVKM